eukprot:PhM_4_TR6371/c0_g1_i1/m.43550
MYLTPASPSTVNHHRRTMSGSLGTILASGVLHMDDPYMPEFLEYSTTPPSSATSSPSSSMYVNPFVSAQNQIERTERRDRLLLALDCNVELGYLHVATAEYLSTTRRILAAAPTHYRAIVAARVQFLNERLGEMKRSDEFVKEETRKCLPSVYRCAPQAVEVVLLEAPMALPSHRTWKCEVCRERVPIPSFQSHRTQCCAAAAAQVRGFMGFQVDSRCVVRAVVADSPACRGGVLKDDVIISSHTPPHLPTVFNGNGKAFTQFIMHVRAKDSVEIKLRRGNTTAIVTCVADEPPHLEITSPRLEVRKQYVRRISSLLSYDAELCESETFENACVRAFYMACHRYMGADNDDDVVLPGDCTRYVAAIVSFLLHIPPPLCEVADNAGAGVARGCLSARNVADVCRSVFGRRVDDDENGDGDVNAVPGGGA